MHTCLITGCGGFIGSHLSEWLLSRGCRVVGTTSRSKQHVDHLNDRLEVQPCEITDQTRLASLIRTAQPEFIFHCAANVIPASWQDPKTMFEVNVLGTISLLEAVREAQPDAMVQIPGSSLEYGPCAPEELPIAETHTPRPTNPYALSKMAAVELGRLYSMRYGLRIHSVRPFQFIGPRKYPDACSEFAKGIVEIERGRTTDLPVGNLNAVRDLLDIHDGVRAMWMIAQHGKPGEVFNICSGVGSTLRDILHEMVTLAGVSVQIREDPAKLRPLDVQMIVGDNSKLWSLGWRQEILMKRTLSEILDYWRGALD